MVPQNKILQLLMVRIGELDTIRRRDHIEWSWERGVIDMMWDVTDVGHLCWIHCGESRIIGWIEMTGAVFIPVASNGWMILGIDIRLAVGRTLLSVLEWPVTVHE
jgi:hypothetical protein